MFKKIKEILYFDVQQFRPPIDNFDIIPEENANLIYDSSKEFLACTVDNLKTIKAKVVLILGFIFSVIALSVPIILEIKNTNPPTNFSSNIAVFLVWIDLIYSIIAAILVLFGLFPMKNAYSGNEPKNIVSQEFLTQKNSIIKIIESCNFQYGIDVNILLADRISRFIKYSLLAMIFSPYLLFIFVFYLA